MHRNRRCGQRKTGDQRGGGKVADRAGDHIGHLGKGDARLDRQGQFRHQIGAANPKVHRLPGARQKVERFLIQQRQRRRQIGRGDQRHLRHRRASGDVGHLKHRSISFHPSALRGQHMAPVQKHGVGVVLQRRMPRAIQHRRQGLDKAHLGVGEFIAQRKARRVTRAQAQRRLHVKERALPDVCRHPAARLGHRRHRPKLQQPVGTDPVEADIQRAHPAIRRGHHIARQHQPLPALDQRQLADIKPERRQPQPQIQRAFGKPDRRLKQAFGIDHHFAERDLADKRIRQRAGGDRRAIRPQEVALAAGPQFQRRAFNCQVRQGDPRRGRIKRQRDPRPLKRDGGRGVRRLRATRVLTRVQRSGRQTQPRIKGGQPAVIAQPRRKPPRDRRADKAQPGQRRRQRPDIGSGNLVDAGRHRGRPVGFGGGHRQRRLRRNRAVKQRQAKLRRHRIGAVVDHQPAIADLPGPVGARVGQGQGQPFGLDRGQAGQTGGGQRRINRIQHLAKGFRPGTARKVAKAEVDAPFAVAAHRQARAQQAQAAGAQLARQQRLRVQRQLRLRQGQQRPPARIDQTQILQPETGTKAAVDTDFHLADRQRRAGRQAGAAQTGIEPRLDFRHRPDRQPKRRAGIGHGQKPKPKAQQDQRQQQRQPEPTMPPRGAPGFCRCPRCGAGVCCGRLDSRFLLHVRPCAPLAQCRLPSAPPLSVCCEKSRKVSENLGKSRAALSLSLPEGN